MPLRYDPLTVKSEDGTIAVHDFYAVPEANQFYCLRTRSFWAKEMVNDVLPSIRTGEKRDGVWVKIKPAAWLRKYRRAEQMTWAPGLPGIIEDRLLLDGGWKDCQGARALNLYLPPTIVHGDGAQARPWIEHFKKLYPEDAEDAMNWCAHRVQRPGVKINHALVMGGGPGIAKDWLLQALKLAVGSWNFQEISPTDLLSPYNPFVRAVVVRLNEAHDLGDSGRFDRFALYERIKIYGAAPPDAVPCVDKWVRRHYVLNVHGLLITTNHKTDGIYLPNDDRRHLVAWSNCTKEDFDKEFWNKRWRWLHHEGGAAHVAAYLAQRDLSTFDPCAVPRQTPAFFEIVNANYAPEDADLADALDELDTGGGRPAVCSLLLIVTTQRGATLEWLADKRKRRSIPHRMERCGYIAVRNPDADDGLWRINRRRQTLYGRTTMTPEERLKAAKDFMLQQTKTAGSS